jgi:hypothetical protein
LFDQAFKAGCGCSAHHADIGMMCTIPAEAETDYYRQNQPAEEAVTQ